MIIFAGEQVPDVGLAGFPEAVYSTTAMVGWNSVTFLEYMKTVNELLANQNIQL